MKGPTVRPALNWRYVIALLILLYGIALFLGSFANVDPRVLIGVLAVLTAAGVVAP